MFSRSIFRTTNRTWWDPLKSRSLLNKKKGTTIFSIWINLICLEITLNEPKLKRQLTLILKTGTTPTYQEYLGYLNSLAPFLFHSRWQFFPFHLSEALLPKLTISTYSISIHVTKESKCTKHDPKSSPGPLQTSGMDTIAHLNSTKYLKTYNASASNSMKLSVTTYQTKLSRVREGGVSPPWILRFVLNG